MIVTEGARRFFGSDPERAHRRCTAAVRQTEYYLMKRKVRFGQAPGGLRRLGIVQPENAFQAHRVRWRDLRHSEPWNAPSSLNTADQDPQYTEVE
jgi:hypothetical protein